MEHNVIAWREQQISEAIKRDIRNMRRARAAAKRAPTIAELCAGPATSKRGILARVFGR